MRSLLVENQRKERLLSQRMEEYTTLKLPGGKQKRKSSKRPNFRPRLSWRKRIERLNIPLSRSKNRKLRKKATRELRKSLEAHKATLGKLRFPGPCKEGNPAAGECGGGEG
jgi:DNA mismatch repair protein MutS2